MVVVRRDLHQIDADHASSAAEAVEELKDLVVQKPAVRRRAGAGGDGGIETVDIDAQVMVNL